MKSGISVQFLYVNPATIGEENDDKNGILVMGDVWKNFCVGVMTYAEKF